MALAHSAFGQVLKTSQQISSVQKAAKLQVLFQDLGRASASVLQHRLQRPARQSRRTDGNCNWSLFLFAELAYRSLFFVHQSQHDVGLGSVWRVQDVGSGRLCAPDRG